MVEPARAADLTAIRELLASERLPAQDLTEAHLAHFIVARMKGSLAGVAGLEPHGDAGLLRSVAVSAPLRGTGLGAALVEAAEARARALGLKSLWLLTTTAAEYFARRGYRTADRRVAPPGIQASPEFSALCPASATCMVKALVGSPQG